MVPMVALMRLFAEVSIAALGHALAAPSASIAIESVVAVLEERLLAPVAALGHVIRQPGQNQTRQMNHQHLMRGRGYLVNWHRNITVIPDMTP